VECRIVACERVVFSGVATGVYARSRDGWFGILPGHAPAAFALAEAPVRVITAEGTRSFQVHGGMLSVEADGVTVLTERASPIP
jgi:F-type H+-transporting ATPase subunit epsilon